MSKSVVRELAFPEPPEEVWRSLTDRDFLAEWMYPNDFEPRVGHRFTFRVPPKPEVKFEGLTVHCEVLECRAPEALTFTWVANGIDTRVAYRLEADGAGTKVYFEHSGFEQANAWAGAGYGWDIMHGKLASQLKEREST